ncbi:MAG: STAS domain-containing protein [Burkholderiaceae bacterium]
MSAAAIKLPESARISGIGGLKDLLEGYESQDGKILIDASELGGIDAAAMQLLVAFSLDQAKQDRTVECINSPELLHTNVRLFGAAEILKVS